METSAEDPQSVNAAFMGLLESNFLLKRRSQRHSGSRSERSKHKTGELENFIFLQMLILFSYLYKNISIIIIIKL